METRGKLISATKDFRSHKPRLTFEVENCTDESANELAAAEILNIRVTKFRRKRSLDANAYFWKLINLISEKQPNTSDEFLHDKFLSENKAYLYDDDGAFRWKVSTDEPNELGLYKERSAYSGQYIYWIDSDMRVELYNEEDEEDEKKPLIDKKTGEPVKGKVFWRIKGTHEMDSKEMSKIIDSVVLEAKSLGIEVLPPAEIERMMEMWGEKNG